VPPDEIVATPVAPKNENPRTATGCSSPDSVQQASGGTWSLLELGDTETIYYHKWESVKGVLHGLGRLNAAHLIMLRKVKFYRHMYFSPNIVVRSLFHTALFTTQLQ